MPDSDLPPTCRLRDGRTPPFWFGTVLLLLAAHGLACAAQGVHGAPALWRWFVWGYGGTGLTAGYTVMMCCAVVLLAMLAAAAITAWLSPSMPAADGRGLRSAICFLAASCLLELIHGVFGYLVPWVSGLFAVAVFYCISRVISDCGHAMHQRLVTRHMRALA